MKDNQLFCNLSSSQISRLIEMAEGLVCYAAPGIQIEPAQAIVSVSKRIGTDLITVSLDFSPNVMRMGYGTSDAVNMLLDAGITINHSPGLRSGLVIIDNEGFIYTPTALYLEAEIVDRQSINALRLSPQQVKEALSRLSPAAKIIALAQAATPEEKSRIANIDVEVSTVQIDEVRKNDVNEQLKSAPPVKFDLARQVHVFEPYLQYVELSLKGASIQSRRLMIPNSIQQLGGAEELEGRLRTTVNLIDRNDELSSKMLSNQLKEIRQNLTHSLGKEHGRVISKKNIPLLEKRLTELESKLALYRKKLQKDLQDHLDESRKAIVEYYLPLVMEKPPDALLGQTISGEATEKGCRTWLVTELDRVFPSSEALVDGMKLEKRYKDVTYDTLNRDDFWESVKNAFPDEDWDKAYNDFLAAGEQDNEQTKPHD